MRKGNPFGLKIRREKFEKKVGGGGWKTLGKERHPKKGKVPKKVHTEGLPQSCKRGLKEHFTRDPGTRERVGKAKDAFAPATTVARTRERRRSILKTAIGDKREGKGGQENEIRKKKNMIPRPSGKDDKGEKNLPGSAKKNSVRGNGRAS